VAVANHFIFVSLAADGVASHRSAVEEDLEHVDPEKLP
jgi:hypothetical protein